MSREISFTKTFLKAHPKAGIPTYFVEKYWKSIGFDYHDLDAQDFLRSINQDRIPLVDELWRTINLDIEIEPKHHTIRSGTLWIPNRYFKPVVWSGDPYHAPKIRLGPDQLIYNVWNLEFDGINHIPSLNKKKVFPDTMEEIAKNDGLFTSDWLTWFGQSQFPKQHFSGQIICWDASIKY